MGAVPPTFTKTLHPLRWVWALKIFSLYRFLRFLSSAVVAKKSGIKTMVASLLVAPLVSAAIAVAAPTEDWKYAVGWDGTVLPSDAIGTPIDNSTSLEKRVPGGVYICENLNWGPPCGYAVQPLGVCIVLGDDWKNKISSFGPDPGAICFGYSQNSCSQAQWSFTYPGDATGGWGTSEPWDDQMTNFMCYGR